MFSRHLEKARFPGLPYPLHQRPGRTFYALSLRELELKVLGVGGHPVDSPHRIGKVLEK